MRLGVTRWLAIALAIAGIATAMPAVAQSRVPMPNVTVDKKCAARTWKC